MSDQSLTKRAESLPAPVARALEARGLTADALRCELQRQQGHGTHKSRGPLTLTWNISFDLPLCKFCGRANPLAVCPAKLKMLTEAL
jgi:hypothetical protein